jgi:hypothetical protein
MLEKQKEQESHATDRLFEVPQEAFLAVRKWNIDRITVYR